MTSVKNQPQTATVASGEPAQRTDALAAGRCARNDEPAGRLGLLYVPKRTANPLTCENVYQPKFASSDLIDSAAALFNQDEAAGQFARFITVSPGTVQLSTHEVGSILSSTQIPFDRLPDREESNRLASNEFWTANEPDSPRGTVKQWTERSRARMVKSICELDLSDWLKPGVLPALVTLTLPGDWLRYAPDAASWHRLIKIFRQRYQRAWGEPLRGIYKREFQGRGAPHAHIFMVPPLGKAVNGMIFRDWLSLTWAEVVGASGDEFRKHRAAGTGIDYAEAVNMRDPRRLAVYFLKSGELATSKHSAKAYQNVAPAQWLEGEKASAGRFWFIWGLEKKKTSVEISNDDWIQARRILRNWYRSKRLTKKVSRPRQRFDTATGELVRTFSRKTTVRRELFKGANGGWVSVNFGPGFASDLARALALLHTACDALHIKDVT